MRRLASLLSLVLVLVVAAGCATARQGNGTKPGASAAASPGTRGPASSGGAGPAFLPDPGRRLWIGAYVNLAGQPAAASVAQRERAMGRPYDLEVTYYNWKDPFPDAGEAQLAANGTIPLMTWYGPIPKTSLAQINSGENDAWIIRQAEAIKAFGHPLLLRLLPEMNGNWYGYADRPAQFVRAWRHVHDLFERAGTTNVAWVWCPNVTPATWDGYYPGNSYVDVIGVDGFANVRYTWETFQQMFGPFFAHFAGRRPMLVAETATNSGAGSATAGIGSAALFISGMDHYLRTVAGPKYGVIAVCWFDTDTNDRFDWRVDQTQASWQAWLAMARSPYFGGHGS